MCRILRRRTPAEMERTTDRIEPFVHLRVHSAYSLLEGALTIPKLAALASADGAPALALTDFNNLFGALEFSGTPRRGWHPADRRRTLSLDLRRREARRPAGTSSRAPRADGRIALLAKDDAGYANLMRLSTNAYFDGGRERRGGHGARRSRRPCARPDCSHRRARRRRSTSPSRKATPSSPGTGSKL